MDGLSQVPITINSKNAGCVAGATNTWTNSVATTCAIKGKFTVALGINSDAAVTPTTDANTGAAFEYILPNYCAAIVFGVNAAGSLVAVQGEQTETHPGVTTTVGAFKLAPQFPSIPDDFCPIAYTIVRVAPSGGAGFLLGTTEWTAASMSCTTFQNIVTMPDRPQIA